MSYLTLPCHIDLDFTWDCKAGLAGDLIFGFCSLIRTNGSSSVNEPIALRSVYEDELSLSCWTRARFLYVTQSQRSTFM